MMIVLMFLIPMLQEIEHLDRAVEDLASDDIEVRDRALESIRKRLRNDETADRLEKIAARLDGFRRDSLEGLTREYRLVARGRIVYLRWVNDREVLWSCRADGSDAKELTDRADVSDPRISPDGSAVAFRWNATIAESSHLVWLDLESGKTRTVTAKPEMYYAAAFEPDGGGILCVKFEDAGAALVRIDLKTGKESFLLRSSDDLEIDASPASRLAVDPRGEFILFSAAADETYGVHRLARASGKVERLTEKVHGSHQLAFSRDGGRIGVAGISPTTGFPDVWMMDRDGSGLTRVTEDRAEEEGPSFSMDGTSILFARSDKDEGMDSDLMIFDLQKRKSVMIGRGHSPAWGPSRFK